ncbi:MAG: helix-turn-helix domain-containing protein [Deltaproteobacteria bacterium]|nr:helix-turn-helix domain-containing protein [Deltaproteobacteria bacterium]
MSNDIRPDNPRDVFFDKLVWTVTDVAKELGCSVRHVRKLVATDRIPYAKVGSLVRFSPSRVSEWLQKGGTR